jgi:hypothetical protein
MGSVNNRHQTRAACASHTRIGKDSIQCGMLQGSRFLQMPLRPSSPAILALSFTSSAPLPTLSAGWAEQHAGWDKPRDKGKRATRCKSTCQ